MRVTRGRLSGEIGSTAADQLQHAAFSMHLLSCSHLLFAPYIARIEPAHVVAGL